MKNIIKAIILVSCIGFVSGCSKVLHHADLGNPCTNKYTVECEQWQREHPKEYAHYVDRMKKQDEMKVSGSSKKKKAMAVGLK